MKMKEFGPRGGASHGAPLRSASELIKRLKLRSHACTNQNLAEFLIAEKERIILKVYIPHLLFFFREGQCSE